MPETGGRVDLMYTAGGALLIAAAVLLCAPVGALVGRLRAYRTRTPAERREQGVLFVLSFLVLLWCLIRLSGGSYNPFIYFRF